MSSNDKWPVVKPLPRFIVQLTIAAFFVLGHAMLWNDRRKTKKASAKVRDTMVLPAYK